MFGLHMTRVDIVLWQYGDVIHSFIERKNYTGPFLPGFKAIEEKDPLASLLYGDLLLANQGISHRHTVTPSH